MMNTRRQPSTGWGTPSEFDKKKAKFKGFGQAKFGGKNRVPKVFSPAEVRAPDLESDEFETVLYKVKDPKIAKSVLNLRERYPQGTVPELVTMDYLNRKQQNYIYQAMFGKNATGGAIVPDFIVVGPGGQGTVWEIQGDWYHTKRKTVEGDRRRSLYFLNKSYQGIKIVNYMEIWESRLYTNINQVLDQALSGIALGRV